MQELHRGIRFKRQQSKTSSIQLRKKQPILTLLLKNKMSCSQQSSKNFNRKPFGVSLIAQAAWLSVDVRGVGERVQKGVGDHKHLRENRKTVLKI